MGEKIVKPKEPTGTPAEKETEQTPEAKEKEGTSEEKQTPQLSEEEFEKLKSELGRVKQELGDERKKVEELNPYKLHYDQTQQDRQQQQRQQQQMTPEKMNEMWFDNPSHMAQMQYQAITDGVSMQMANQAKFIAKMQNPGAFEGIDENQLDQAMYGGAQANIINKQALADPNAWIFAAWGLRGKESGYQFPQAPTGNLPTTETEKPGKPSASDDEDEIPRIEGDDATLAMIENAKKHGVTKEQLEKMIHERREREKR